MHNNCKINICMKTFYIIFDLDSGEYLSITTSFLLNLFLKSTYEITFVLWKEFNFGMANMLSSVN